MSRSAKNQVEIGQVIGWGTVIEPDVELPNGRGALLRCRCGREYTAYRSNLKAGNNKSCGCAKKIAAREIGRKTSQVHVTHNLSKSPIYQIWTGMIHRCHNPKSKDYPRYGARGIQVCSEWRNDVAAFVAWVDRNLGPRPQGWSIDRINNDGNYEPGNVRWATHLIQQNNQRPRSQFSFKEKICTRCQKSYKPTGPAQRFCSDCK